MIINSDSHPDQGRMSILAPNNHVIPSVISVVKYKDASTKSGCKSNKTDHPKTDLDSHANMVFLGMNALIFQSTGKTCSVKPFSSELGVTDNVPFVDVAMA